MDAETFVTGHGHPDVRCCAMVFSVFRPYKDLNLYNIRSLFLGVHHNIFPSGKCSAKLEPKGS